MSKAEQKRAEIRSRNEIQAKRIEAVFDITFTVSRPGRVEADIDELERVALAFSKSALLRRELRCRQQPDHGSRTRPPDRV